LVTTKRGLFFGPGSVSALHNIRRSQLQFVQVRYGVSVYERLATPVRQIEGADRSAGSL
jgi:hypothetical protein